LQYFQSKNKKSFSSCIKRENLGFCVFNYLSLRVFVINHNLSLTTIEAYQNSDKGDQVEKIFRHSGRTTVVVDKQITCLMQENVNFKGFVSVNFLYFHYSIID
jgi:hypothetical protein